MPELVGLARTMRSLAAAGRDLARRTSSTPPAPAAGPRPSTSRPRRRWSRPRAGCAVAKHGNRSNTSRCGSADLLEALGVNIELDPEQVGRCIDEVGFGFMFAPRHHAAMAHVVPVRKELGVRTIFNFLGPLTNPAGAERQLLGVSDRHYQETIAEALVGLGSERAMVVAAEDGARRALDLRPHPGDRGRRRRAPRSGSSSRASSASPRPSSRRSPAAPRRRTPPPSRAVLDGEQGPRRDLVVLNAGAAIYVGGGAESLDGGRREGRRGDRQRRGGRAARAAGCGDRRRSDRLGFVCQVGMIEQLISAARDGVEERRGQVSAGRPRVAASRPRRGPPVQRGAGPARASR